jgi:hypothetical protein
LIRTRFFSITATVGRLKFASLGIFRHFYTLNHLPAFVVVVILEGWGQFGHPLLQFCTRFIKKAFSAHKQ